MLAESGRVPFDIQEAEAELVTGYHVEYGGMRFGVFPLAEWYLNVMALSAIAVVLFLGGWSGPHIFGPLSPYLWFLIKMFGLVFFCPLATLDATEISGKGYHRNWLEGYASFGNSKRGYNRLRLLFCLRCLGKFS
jgi:hypothetical protein